MFELFYKNVQLTIFIDGHVAFINVVKVLFDQRSLLIIYSEKIKQCNSLAELTIVIGWIRQMY